MGCGLAAQIESTPRQSEGVLFASGDGGVSAFLLNVKSPKTCSGYIVRPGLQNNVHRLLEDFQAHACISTPSPQTNHRFSQKRHKRALPTRQKHRIKPPPPPPQPSHLIIQLQQSRSTSSTCLVSKPKPPVKTTRATKPGPARENMQASSLPDSFLASSFALPEQRRCRTARSLGCYSFMSCYEY